MLLLHAVSAALALSSTSVARNVPKIGGHWPSLSSRSVYEKLSAPPTGWVADASKKLDKEVSTLKLRVQLVPQNLEKFHELAMNVATPGHESYGKHVPQHVIDSIIAPREESSDLVLQWIRDAGLGDHATLSPRSDAVVVEASVSQIEKLLDAEYTSFVRPSTGDSVVRTLEYSIPDAIKSHVKMIQPTTFFGLREMRSTISSVRPIDRTGPHANANANAAADYVTPESLQTLYNFGSAPALTAGKFGIAGFLEEYPSEADLATFLESYAVQGNGDQSYTCIVVNDGACPENGGSSPGVEANLDVQYGRAITQSIPNVYYSTGGRPPIVGDDGDNTNEPYLEFLNYLLELDDADLPQTLSISYGEEETTIPLDYTESTCDLFSQLGARGVSILVASGDSGVGDSCTIDGQPAFTAAYPASCPWVTTVGGTTGSGPEGAWSYGGGGFSGVFARPSYQDATVSSWLENDATHSGVADYFNSSGRAYPDVSAQAEGFAIVVGGIEQSVGGTSCAAPTFAGVIQLLNSARVADGKPGLGFLNPWLYSDAVSGFNDISSGSIGGCTGVIDDAGFQAITGWDPATGLGTPNYEKLAAISEST